MGSAGDGRQATDHTRLLRAGNKTYLTRYPGHEIHMENTGSTQRERPNKEKHSIGSALSIGTRIWHRIGANKWQEGVEGETLLFCI